MSWSEKNIFTINTAFPVGTRTPLRECLNVFIHQVIIYLLYYQIIIYLLHVSHPPPSSTPFTHWIYKDEMTDILLPHV